MHIKIKDLLDALDVALANVYHILDGEDIPTMISTMTQTLQNTQALRSQMDVIARSIDRLYRPVIEFLLLPRTNRLQVLTVKNLLKGLRQKLRQPYHEVALAIAISANTVLQDYGLAIISAVRPIFLTLAFITTFGLDEQVRYNGVEVALPPHFYRDQDGAPIIPPLQRRPRGRGRPPNIGQL